MTHKERYAHAKIKLLGDPSICAENRQLFAAFFDYEEYKLKRQNDLRELDEPSYKTVYEYTVRLRCVNKWFANKPWKRLTREDIQRVYDGLEDGTILTKAGVPYKGTRHYYNKVLKSKPFELAGKAQLAREVIIFPKRQRREVRYLPEEGFFRLVSVLSKPHHLLLFWLSWDIGENIDALLKLQKRDFTRAADPHTREAEYRVNLPDAKIKRSRQTRTEPTLYAETVRYADMVLAELADDDAIFHFGYRQAVKLIHAAGRKTGVTCLPDNSRVRWKDLRSGMACHLLSMGWQPHEVNLRLGHRPNSDTLNDYINFLAIDRHRPKQRLHTTTLHTARTDLKESKERERLSRDRLHRYAQENQQMKAQLEEARAELRAFKAMVMQELRDLRRAA